VIAQHVRWIERGHPAVVALGGGAFAEARNRELLLDHGLAVWLDCPLDVVKQRVAQASHRPLARDAEKFEALYHARRQCYALADVHVAIESDDPGVTVRTILSHCLLK